MLEATLEVVAEMVDMRTFDGCKDTTFEACAMFEVVGKVLDAKMLDIAQRMMGDMTLKLEGIAKMLHVTLEMRMLVARGMTYRFQRLEDRWERQHVDKRR